MLLRLFFKKFPKWIFVLLWGVVAIRLVCPIFIESDISLIPSATVISKAPDSPRPYFDSGVSVLDDQVNEYLHGYYFEGITRPMGYFDNVMEIFSNVWIIGMILLFIYTFYSCYRIKSKISTAVRFRDNVYQSENVYYLDSTNQLVIRSTFQDASGYPIIITIEYTKTTD